MNTLPEINDWRLLRTVDGVRTYRYLTRDSDGVTCGRIRVFREDGTVIEDRPEGWDDLAGHSPASIRFGY